MSLAHRTVWSGRAACAALVLAAGVVLQYGTGGAYGFPFVVAWGLLIVAGLGGWGTAGWWPTHRRRVPVALVGGLVGIGALATVQAWWLHVAGREIAIFVVLLVIAAAVGGLTRRRVLSARPLTVLVAAEAIAIWLIVDAGHVSHVPGLYDLLIYRNAGAAFLAGHDPYLTAVLTRLPPDTGPGPYLYPPVFLPLASALSCIPFDLLRPIWVVLLLACGFGAFRLLGLSTPWSVALLAFPPLVKGVESGNVANLLFLIVAGGVRLPSALPLAGMLKIQAGIPAFWLLRERRWRSLLAAAATVALLVVVTLPITGWSSWSGWLRSLDLYRASAERLPILYGLSLAKYLPYALFVLVAVVSTGMALALSGRRGLAALGVSSIVASPSLWSHGLLLAVPAALSLSAPLLWLALGIGSSGPTLWTLPVMAAVAVAGDWERRSIPVDLHPLAGTRGPWAPALIRAVASPG